jgi:hypothetical protein
MAVLMLTYFSSVHSEHYICMSDSAASYPDFRRRLDDVLRQRDPIALRAFLIAEGQWTTATATDPESAMWMMIATSPALASLRDDARHWLLTHGHEAEAQAIFGGQRSQGKPPAPGGQSHSRRPGRPTNNAGNAGKPTPRSDNKRPRR